VEIGPSAPPLPSEPHRASLGGRSTADDRGDRADGGTPARQVLATELLDELELHVVPVVLGTGMRLLDDLNLRGKELTPTRVVHTPDVTHLRYIVNGRALLVLDDRGRGD
jgi:hypothetical protein